MFHPYPPPPFLPWDFKKKVVKKAIFLWKKTWENIGFDIRDIEIFKVNYFEWFSFFGYHHHLSPTPPPPHPHSTPTPEGHQKVISLWSLDCPVIGWSGADDHVQGWWLVPLWHLTLSQFLTYIIRSSDHMTFTGEFDSYIFHSYDL